MGERVTSIDKLPSTCDVRFKRPEGMVEIYFPSIVYHVRHSFADLQVAYVNTMMVQIEY